MLFDRICLLCKESGTTVGRLEKDCGLANATIRRWAINAPSAENLAKVADHFGVSVDYLLGRGPSVAAQEYAKRFDALPDDKKKLAAAYMQVVEATMED